MTSEQRTIKTAYEEENMTPLQIAECQDLDEVAVKACLLQVSSLYRKDCGQELMEGKEERLNFTDEQLERINSVIYDIAVSSENDKTRLEAAMYIRDDKKGRKDTNKGIGGQNFNILMINEQLRSVRSAADRVRKTIVESPRPLLAN